jgi:hypothetical protein
LREEKWRKFALRFPAAFAKQRSILSKVSPKDALEPVAQAVDGANSPAGGEVSGFPADKLSREEYM